MAMIVGHWQLKGYGMWAVEERSTGELVGRIGLFNPEGWPGFELGWVLGHAFTDMGRDHVISLIYPANAASIRVAERVGETLEGRVDLFGHEALVYGVARPRGASSR
jgi:RimJ/RimL family protein N-acetyltransferase